MGLMVQKNSQIYNLTHEGFIIAGKIEQGQEEFDFETEVNSSINIAGSVITGNIGSTIGDCNTVGNHSKINYFNVVIYFALVLIISWVLFLGFMSLKQKINLPINFTTTTEKGV